jgi:hypothetical protein
MTLTQALSVVIIASVIQFLIITVYHKTLLPLQIGKNTRLDAVVHVSGEERELEATVKNLISLRSCGGLKMDIYIIDEGMDQDTRETAKLLARDSDSVVLYPGQATDSEC